MIPCCESVGFQSGSLKHQGKGKLSIRVRALDGAPLQHDDTLQMSVSRALLVKEQVGLKDKPPSVVSRITLFL